MRQRDPCEYGDGFLEDKIVRARFPWKGNTIYVDDVPAQVCPRCHSQYFSGPVYKRLEQIAKQSSRIKKKISFPLAKYDMVLSEVMFNDIGKLVGYYLVAWGCLSIVGTIVQVISTGALFIDVSFLFFFWAGSHLMNHRQAARKWTIGICGFMLACSIVGFVFAAIRGIPWMTVTLVGRIENPSLWQVTAMTAVLALLFGLPFVLLLTPRARREFQPITPTPNT